MRNRGCTIAAALLLVMSGCAPVLTRFWVPNEVAGGSVFEIVLSGTSPLGTGAAGCVVQLPDGFEVEGWAAWGVDSPAPAPSLLATYTAEVGHHLVAYRGDRTTIPDPPRDGGLRLFVRTPDAVGGTFAIKAALAGQASGATTWSATDPAGVTDFAAMTTSPYRRTLRTVEHPPSGAVIEVAGTWSDCASFGALGDLDGDGHGDIVWTEGCSGPGTLSARLWRPDGWITRTYPQAPQVGPRLAIGDFNRDGCPDVVDAGGRYLLGDCGHSWAAGPSLPVAGVIGGWAMQPHDVDGDGWLDLVQLRSRSVVSVFRNNAGTGWIAVHLANPNSIGPLLVADLNGDRHMDLVSFPSVWFANGTGGWIPGPDVPVGLQMEAATLADTDGDGVAEIAYASRSDTWLSRWGPSGWSTSLVALQGTHSRSSGDLTCFLAALDWDGDDADELVLGPAIESSAPDTATFTMLKDQGGQTFSVVPTAGFGVWINSHNWMSAEVHDLDGNGIRELAVFERSRDGTVTMVAVQPARSGVTQVGAGCGQPEPVLQTSGFPSRGNASFAANLSGGQAGGPAVLWIGRSQRTLFGQSILPLELTPFGAPGCWLRTEPLLLAGAACDPTGTARWALPIPGDPVLLRVTAFLQGAVARAGANPIDLVLSNTLAVRVD